MKFLKSQNTSRYSPSDNTIQVNPYGRVVMDVNGGLLLPKGTTAQRPQLSGVRQPTDANGTIRYNTSTNTIEAYVGNNWEVVRAPGASTITKQTLGPGDAVDDLFGPLTLTPASADNIIVLVENVIQISTTNFSLSQNPSVTGVGEEIVATSMTNGTEYVIIDLATGTPTDFTLVGAGWEESGSFTIGATYTIKIPGTTDFVTEHGAADNNVGTTFTAAVAGTGTGKALPATYTQSIGDVFTYDNTNGAATGDSEVRETGWYLQFTSPVPSSKYITVYFGFAN